MNYTVTAYLLYLTGAIPMTVWVANTLRRNGRVFLVDCFKKNEELADSVNHLLVVGFYLVNLGFILLFLKTGEETFGTRELIELVSWKLGVVLFVLGVMHFVNLRIFTRLRRREDEVPPALPPAFGD